MASGSVEAVITFGSMAKKAWNEWKKTPTGAASTIPAAHLIHPTQPESAGGTKFLCVAEASAANKLNQTLLQIDDALGSALRGYDEAHPDLAAPPLSPISPLFSCPA